MFCSNCGKEIDNKAVVCIHCGVATQNMKSDREPIIINNSSSSASSASSAAGVAIGKIRRHRSLLFDLFMICITGGLWIIWMIVRPKYY